MRNLIALTSMQIAIIIIVALAIALIVVIMILAEKNRKKADPRKNLDVQQPEFAEPLLNKQNEMFVSMARNVTYSVGKEKEVKPGAYILRASGMGSQGFNLRYNGLVKEYPAETHITLGEGDTICCTSDTLVVVADL